MWLSDRQHIALAKNYLLTQSAPANVATDPKGVFSTTVMASGLTHVYTGNDVDTQFGAQYGESHAPNPILSKSPSPALFTAATSKRSPNTAGPPPMTATPRSSWPAQGINTERTQNKYRRPKLHPAF